MTLFIYVIIWYNTLKARQKKGAGFLNKEQLRQKYDLDNEFTDSQLLVTPCFFANPVGMKILNTLYTMNQSPLLDGISRTVRYMKGSDGEDVKLYIYEKVGDRNVTKPVILFIHGGGFYLDYLSHYHVIASNYAKYADCKVVSVCYRTLLTSTYRTSLSDCYEALNWIYDNAERFHLDKDKIAVVGDSAGGSLAAALTHLTRDLNGPKLVYQVLNFPCTTSKANQNSMKEFTDTPGWNSKLHRSIFRYIGPSITSDMRKYFDLTDKKNFNGICDAYVEVEEFDCLRDQGIEYANLLQENGCTVSLNETKGTFHGFDMYQSLEITKRIMKTRCERLQNAWSKED